MAHRTFPRPRLRPWTRLSLALLVGIGACDDQTPTSQSLDPEPRFGHDPAFTPIDDPYPGHIENGAIQLEMETIAEGRGLTAPVWGTHAPGHPDILFVADQDGPLWAINVRSGAKTVCLNTRPLLVPLGAFGPESYDERGFLGVAFHPDFATNGLLYTYTSEPNGMPPGAQPDHWSRIREWRVANPAADPLARPNTEDDAAPGDCGATMTRVVLEFEQPQFNHNGGAIFFGVRPLDRTLLYVTSGDGGCADDQNRQTGFLGETCIGHGPGSEATEPSRAGNGQDPNVIWGKILRIDPAVTHPPVRVRDPFPAANIFAYGFRNPYRGSVDRETGEVWTADVGQNLIEEVDGPIVQGGNYGWRFKEGEWLFHPDEYAIDFASDGFIYAHSPGVPADMIDPAAEYDHDEGVAVVGGFVYRGSRIPELRGRYVFGDYSDGFKSGNGRVMYLDPTNNADPKDRTPRISNLINGHTNVFVLGFGEDSRGELYVLANKPGIPFDEEGVVMRLVRKCADRRDCRD